MNKVYIVSSLVFTGILFASAQEGGVTNETGRVGPPAPMPGIIQQGEGRPMLRALPPVQVKQNTDKPSVMPIQAQKGEQGSLNGVRGTLPPVQAKQNTDKPTVMPVQSQKGEQGSQNGVGGGLPKPSLPTTGDPVIDAQLKTLTVEMETKIKAISDEYRTKIQALLATKSTRIYPQMASGTPPQRMMQPLDGNSQEASSTQEQMMRDVQSKIQGEVDRQNKMKNAGPAPKMPVFQQMNNFFQGIFGRGN